MSTPTDPSAPRRTPALPWWTVGAAAAAVLLPLPGEWDLALQGATVIFGVVVLCIARGRAARRIAAAVVVVVGAVVCLQVATEVGILLSEQTFVDDAVVLR